MTYGNASSVRASLIKDGSLRAEWGFEKLTAHKCSKEASMARAIASRKADAASPATRRALAALGGRK